MVNACNELLARIIYSLNCHDIQVINARRGYRTATYSIEIASVENGVIITYFAIVSVIFICAKDQLIPGSTSTRCPETGHSLNAFCLDSPILFLKC